MNVIIDGIKYVPAPPECADAGPLEVRRYVNDLDREVSLREYLYELLATLVVEGEGFSGKRPFGNSGWEYDIEAFLVKSGAVAGELDDDGWADNVDRERVKEILPGLITQALGIAPATNGTASQTSEGAGE